MLRRLSSVVKGKKSSSSESVEARETMESDPDIQKEAADLLLVQEGRKVAVSKVDQSATPLYVKHGAHHPSSATVKFLDEVGGLDKLRKFTTRFYQKAFRDKHIDAFIRSHEDPHGERFASWIAEKFGHGKPWSQERSRRARCPVSLGHGHQTVVHDRSSAHFAAWHSPKRDHSVWGQHFNLVDCRIWMRLHFWAAREEGLLNHPGFSDYYVRFIAHFVSVYERKAPPFARESMRWSADPENIKKYIAEDCRMNDVIGQSYDIAWKQLPSDERTYTGSSAHPLLWPYA